VRSIDWRDAFTDDTRREDKRFRRKQDDREFPIGLEIGLRDGEIQLPRGAIAGQKIALLLRSLTLHVPSDQDFDDLPIPYRAVAADLVTGEPYAMQQGDLARAIRASMAAPGVFAPVVFNGRTLVDGGLDGNVPVATIREMDVDVIIAVDVEFPLYAPDQLNTALDVTAQMLTILIRNQTREQLATLGPDDILIRPDLGQLGSADFDGIEAAVEPGVEAARESAGQLRSLALGAEAFAAHLAGRQSLRIEAPDRVDFVRITADTGLAPQVLEARLTLEDGDTADADSLAADAASLYGLETFERVGYRFIQDNELTGVEFTGDLKPWGPNYLRFGLALQDDFDGTTSFDLSARLTRTGLNTLGAEWRSDLRAGTRPYFRTELYQPLSFNSRYFFAPRLEAGQDNFSVFAANDNVARYRITNTEIGLDLGREFGKWGEFRAGVFRGSSDASIRVGDPALPELDLNTGGSFARLAFDTLDNGQIPHSGIRGEVQWVRSSSALGADADADAIETNVNLVRTFGRHSLSVGALLNVALDDDTLVQNFYPLGGFLRLSGLAQGEISGPHAGVARLVYYRRSGETGGLFEIPLYIGASLEAGNVWERRSDIGFDSMIASGSVFLGFDTFFGPVYLAAGIAEGGRSNFYLSVGVPP
ncbi:MAG: patatin-like phospholipase family protein, partial [Pseudomonadota bacterium]